MARPRLGARCALTLVVAGLVSAGLGSGQPVLGQQRPAARVGEVSVDVLGLHSSRGRVLAALYCSEAGFPNKVQQACARKLAKIVNKRVRLVFDAVPAGEFALSLFHDENANATLDTNWLGMPSEGWAMSRDAKANFGPPLYADARLSLAVGERKRIVVHIQ
ncbi:MAG: hypothetical protein RL701_159 [Pseudomonadota bacterium]